MSRPKSKQELLDLSQANFSKLLNYIDSLRPDVAESEFPKGYLNRKVEDVLAHLHEWHLMMLRWYEEGMAGKNPKMPAPGYSWKDLPELNRQIWKKYHAFDLEEVRALVEKSFAMVYRIIESHSDEELFTKKKYHWTGSTSLGAYLISATSSHYDWALKLIKKCLKPVLGEEVR